MRVLVIFSNPPGQSTLRLDMEDKIIARIARKHDQDVDVTRLHASEVDDVHSLIVNGHFDVVQFSGHGSKGGIFLDKGDLGPDGELVSPARPAPSTSALGHQLNARHPAAPSAGDARSELLGGGRRSC